MPNMKVEKVIVREELELIVKNIFPSMIDDNFLVENKFIDSKKLVKKGTYTVASWGSHIEIEDSTKTSINISVNNIKIRSKDYNRLVSFYDIISKNFENQITEVSYTQILHYEDENIFNKVMSLMLCKTEMEVDILRLKKENYIFDVYECAPNRLHLALHNKMLFNKKFNFSNFIKNSASFFDNFISNDLNLSS